MLFISAKERIKGLQQRVSRLRRPSFKDMKKVRSWQELNMPTHDGSSWSILRDSHLETPVTFSQVREAVKSWLPPNNLLIGQPGGKKFVTPIEIAELQNTAKGALYKHTRNVSLMFFPPALIFLFSGLVSASKNELLFGALLMLIGAIFLIDYFVLSRSSEAIYQRSLFFFWLKSTPSAKWGLWFWLAVGMSIGGLQIASQVILGGLGEIFSAFGLIYSRVEEGEVWRFMTGPYLHFSSIHFSLNLLLLIIGGWLSWALIGPQNSVLVFMIGNLIAGYAQYAFGGRLFEIYGGISGGVYALFGLLLVSWAFKNAILPRGLVVVMAGILCIGEMGNVLLIDSSATVAHMAGFCVGVVAAIIIVSWEAAIKIKSIKDSD